jgi:hypothetical protein
MGKSTSKNKVVGAVLAVAAAAAGIFGVTQLPAGGQIVGPIYVNADAQAGGDGTEAAPFNNLADAAGAQSAQREAIYILASDADLPAITANITLNALGGNQRVVRGVGNIETLITIGEGGSVTVAGGVVDGAGIASAGPLFYLDGGDLYMNAGEIRNNYSLSNGGAVFIASGNAELNGAELLNNIGAKGGAVFIAGADSNFLMTAGAISGNTATAATPAGVSAGEITEQYGVAYWNPRASGADAPGPWLALARQGIAEGVVPQHIDAPDAAPDNDLVYTETYDEEAAKRARIAELNHANSLNMDELAELIELLREAA